MRAKLHNRIYKSGRVKKLREIELAIRLPIIPNENSKLACTLLVNLENCYKLPVITLSGHYICGNTTRSPRYIPFQSFLLFRWKFNPSPYIYIHIHIHPFVYPRVQVHGFHLKPLSESSCARQRDRLRREFVFAQCFRFIIDESLPAFPPLIPRNVLKQVLIKSREEFIYIYIYLSSSPPLYNSRFSATCYCAHAFYCLSNYALTDR